MNALPLLALTMGFVSSLHCIGMCGPIALALPVTPGNKWRQTAGLLFYHFGRASSYALLGVLIGSVGVSIALIGLLKYLTIAVGITLIATVLKPSLRTAYFHTPAFWNRTIQQLKKQMAKLMRGYALHRRFFLGFLNGLLPCGMVYMALLTSVATGSVAGSGTYMFLFGLSTFPAMFLLGVAKQKLNLQMRKRIARLTPFIIVLAGIWLVARGFLTDFAQSQHTHPANISICK